MIYVIQQAKNGPVKIGKSNDPQKRLSQIQTSNPVKLELIWTVEFDRFKEQDYYDLEARIHEELSDYRLRGEWFRWCNFVAEAIDNNLSIVSTHTTSNGNQIKYTESFHTGIDIVSIKYKEEL